MMRLVISFFLATLLFYNVHAQPSTSKFDSLVITAKKCLIYEDVHGAEFFIQSMVPLATNQYRIEILNSLKLEKLVLERNFDEANEYIQHARKARSKDIVLHSMIMEGRILNRQRQFKESVKILDEVKAKLESRHMTLSIELFHWLGSSLMEIGNYKRASQYLREATFMCSEDSIYFFVKLAQVRITSGINFKRAGDFQASEREYKMAIRILENTPLAKYNELSRAYINLANVYNEQLNYLLAKSYYQKSLQLNQIHLRDSAQLTILYNNLALFYQKYGNLLKAREYYDLWHTFFNERKQNFKGTSFGMLLNYAAFLDHIFEYGKEHQILLEASLDLNKDSSPEDWLRLMLARTNNFIELKWIDSTNVEIKKATEVVFSSEEIGKALLYKFYSLEGVLSTNSGNFAKADSLIQLAIKTALEMGDDNAGSVADAYRIQGLNFSLQENHNKAAQCYKRAIRSLGTDSQVFDPLRIQLLNHIGISFWLDNQYDSAQYYLKDALQSNRLPITNDASSFSDPFEILISNYHLLQLAMKGKSDQWKDAEIYILVSNSIIDDKRHSLKSFEDQKLYNRAVREFFNSAVGYYQQMFMLTGETVYFSKAFEMAEKARYQILQQSLRDVRIGEFAGITQRITQEEQATQVQIGLLTKQIIDEAAWGLEANSDLLNECNKGLAVLETRYARILDSLKNNLPGIYNLKFSTATVSASALQKDVLKGDMALIQYHVGDKKIHVMIVTKDKQYIIELKDKTQLLKTIRQLATINRLRLSREFIPVAHELYEHLMQPVDSLLVSNKIKINHYILVPDGEINYVPFDVLITKPAAELNKCKFLLTEKILSYGYSSTLLWQEFSNYSVELRNAKMLSYAPTFNRQTEVGLNETGLRNTTSRSQYATFDFQPLQNNTQEVKNISKIVKQKGYQDDAMFAEQADEASFKRKNLNDYQIIHLATHGFVDYPTNQSSGIAFSYNEASGEDGILFMDEIFSLRSRAHLVCLSACQTGFGKVDVGEGMMSMTRAFLYSGVKNLVVSLWSVQDNSTAMLMENFYKQFVKSKSISLSLRSAKLQMLKEKEFSHPYNWAGFIHVGLN